MLSWIVPSEKQQNADTATFLNTFEAVNPKARVIIVTDAGFQNARFRHIKSLGWVLLAGYDNKQLIWREKECWFRRRELQASNKPDIWGRGRFPGRNSRPLRWSFYLQKEPGGKYSRCGMARPSQIKDAEVGGKEWLSAAQMTLNREKSVIHRRMRDKTRDEKSGVLGSVCEPVTAVRQEECWY
ncbi:hypothetical protein HVW88_02760 [Escherichia coli]|nr:hypothetical protein [Escherichia coli]